MGPRMEGVAAAAVAVTEVDMVVAMVAAAVVAMVGVAVVIATMVVVAAVRKLNLKLGQNPK